MKKKNDDNDDIAHLIIAIDLLLSSVCGKARVETNNNEQEWGVDLFSHPAAKK